MPAWSWWLIFVGIAIVAVLVLGGLGLGVWRRVKVVMADLDRVSALAAAFSATLGGIDQPRNPAMPTPARHRG